MYSHNCGWNAAYPIQKVDGNHVGNTLTQFISDYGAPKHLTIDGASVQTGPKTRFMDAIRRYKIKNTTRRPHDNPVKQSIHEVKKRWYQIILKKKVQVRLQDYRFLWVRETGNMCVKLSKYAKDGTPIKIFTGNTSNMSEYLDFEFYDWVLHQSSAGLGEVELGRWMGVSHSVGQRMSYC